MESERVKEIIRGYEDEMKKMDGELKKIVSTELEEEEKKKELDISESSPGIGLGSGTVMLGCDDGVSYVHRIAIGSSIDMSGVLNTGDVVLLKSGNVCEDTDSTKMSKSIILQTSERVHEKWLLVNAPSRELRQRDPEQWEEILSNLVEEDVSKCEEDKETGDIVFTSSSEPPGTLVWKYSKACKKGSKDIFGRVMMTRPLRKSVNVKKVVKNVDSFPSTEQKQIILECEEVDTAAALRKAIQDAKDLDLNVSDAFKMLRRKFKRKEIKRVVFRERRSNSNMIKTDSLFPILSSNHIDSEPIVKIMYVKFHRVEDELDGVKGSPFIVVSTKSTTFKTSDSKLTRSRGDVRIFEWTDEVATFRFTKSSLEESQNLTIDLMDSKGGKLWSWKRGWSEFSPTQRPLTTNITELEFDNNGSDDDNHQRGSLHLSVSFCVLCE